MEERVGAGQLGAYQNSWYRHQGWSSFMGQFVRVVLSKLAHE
jgi:hypothetical protein